MRDKRFIAEHRGGPLKKEQHYQLITWACDCAEHVVHLFGETLDERLIHALHVAHEWKSGNASVGDAMKASVDCTCCSTRIFRPDCQYSGPFRWTGCCNCSYG